MDSITQMKLTQEQLNEHLFNACDSGIVAYARLALAVGADITSRDSIGWTPIQLAARREKYAVVGELIAHGADRNDLKPGELLEFEEHQRMRQQEKDGVDELNALLTRTAKQQRSYVVRKKAREDMGREAANLLLWDAIAAEDIVAAERAIAAGANTKAQSHGWTLLHEAVAQGFKPIVELLIANCADVDARNAQDETPLDWAILRGNEEVADYLRSRTGRHTDRISEERKNKGRPQVGR